MVCIYDTEDEDEWDQPCLWISLRNISYFQPFNPSCSIISQQLLHKYSCVKMGIFNPKTVMTGGEKEMLIRVGKKQGGPNGEILATPPHPCHISEC